jgi:hypothetical protein
MERLYFGDKVPLKQRMGLVMWGKVKKEPFAL